MVAFATREGDGTLSKPYKYSYPLAAVTGPMFKSVQQGGLGLDPEVFYWRTFGVRNETLISKWQFPYRDNNMLWITDDTDKNIPRYGC